MLFAALIGLFWVEQLEPRGWFVPREGSPFARLGGTTYVQLEDVEPYVLTEPNRFPGLATDGYDEPALIRWLEVHIPPAPADGPGGDDAPAANAAPLPSAPSDRPAAAVPADEGAK